MIDAILKYREEMLLDMYNNLTIDEKRDMLVSGLRNKMSRNYSDISEQFGVEIIWGSGGAQTKKRKDLIEQGTGFVEIPASSYSTEKDLNAIRKSER